MLYIISETIFFINFKGMKKVHIVHQSSLCTAKGKSWQNGWGWFIVVFKKKYVYFILHSYVIFFWKVLSINEGWKWYIYYFCSKILQLACDDIQQQIAKSTCNVVWGAMCCHVEMGDLTIKKVQIVLKEMCSSHDEHQSSHPRPVILCSDQ